MTRSLKILLAAAGVFVLLGACPSQAQDCKSQSQARRANPNVHLYYRLEGHRAGGRKCWYARGEDRPRYRIVTQSAKPIVAEEEPRRTIFEEIFSYFAPRPALAAEEEEEPKTARKDKKRIKVAQRSKPESPRSIDAKVFDLCGPFDTGVCSANVRARRAQ